MNYNYLSTQTLLTKELLTVALSNAKETEEYYDKIVELMGIDRRQDSNKFDHRNNICQVITDTLKNMIGEDMYEKYEDEIENCFSDLIYKDDVDIDEIIEFFDEVSDSIDRETFGELDDIVRMFVRG